jgi:Beta-galactosidase
MSRCLFVLGFLISLAVRQDAVAQDRAAVKTNLEQISKAVEKYEQAKPFPIMPWDQMQAIDGPEDRVHGLASLVKCNFTYAGFPRVEDLPACEKLGLRAIVHPADSLGLTKPAQLSDEQIDKAVRTLAEQTKGSPACVGYFLRDEPGASQFAYLGKIVAAIRRHAPGKLAYINLLPSYATAGEPGGSQLETKSFTEYLERYVAEVKPDFLSYDNYMVEYSQDLRDRQTGAIYFRDLVEVRRVALEHGLPFWNIVTCVQIRPNTTPPSPANLLLQGWTTLAAGGHGVSWYKYEQKGYLYCPIDLEHKQTATWSYLQMVNHQLQMIGPIVSRLKSISVYFTASAPLDGGPKLPGKLVTKLEADSPLMIGEFASKGEAVDHLVLVNLSLERTAKVPLKDLRSLGTIEEYSPQDGHLAKCGAEIYLPGGQGVLLKVTR